MSVEVIVRVIVTARVKAVVTRLDIEMCKPLLHNSVYQCIIHSYVHYLLQ